MTRTVRDAAMILDVISGSDVGDPWSEEADANRGAYVEALDDTALRGVRLGVLGPSGAAADDTRALFERSLEVLESEGAVLVELPTDALVDPRPEMRTILLHDFKVDLNSYLAGTPSSVPVRTLADLIAFSTTDPRESMHTMDMWVDAEATRDGRESAVYVEALETGRRLTREEGIDRLLREHDVVALVSPTGAPAGVIRPDGTEGPGPIPPGPRGTRPAVAHDDRRRGRLPAHLRADGTRGRATGRDLVRRYGVVGGAAAGPRVRLRAGVRRARPSAEGARRLLMAGGRAASYV